MAISSDVVVTKRLILSCIARVFDPLGLITPFVISVKILFQEVWELGLTWDESVPDNIERRFSTWINDMVVLPELSFARSFVSISWKEKRGVELHCFCDASLKAYGAVVYLKVQEADGSVSISLVLSKARVSPLKPVTLPRLELLGAVIGAKIVRSVIGVLQLPDDVKYHCWTDSTVALQWIQSDPTKWKMFVCNRVVQIQELTAPENWSHCAGIENPADLLTRGLSARELLKNPLWFHGPSWLNGPIQTEQIIDDSQNVSGEEAQVTNVCLSKTEVLEEVLSPERWGDFSKAVRITAWILRFVNKSRRKNNVADSNDLTVGELQLAKQKLCWYIQRLHFSEEIDGLSKGQQVKKDSPLHKIKPFLDEDGMLRMTGRIQFSDLSVEEKHPMILPRCHLTYLLVRREHASLKHCGVPQMMASLRNQFWIIGLRSMAKRAKRKCVRCQRYDSAACTQVVSPLPKERLTRASPFSITGVDYAGPLYTVDKTGKKFYILIFTCAVVRAVHIELCESLTLTDFMFAFRRFVSRRGMPVKILSDNAKTFQAAAKQITVSRAEESTKWIFNAPRAPWRGGIWERLVRSVKLALKKSIGNRCLTRVELETVLIEIESCINSRPLTYVSDDPGCLGVLSPSHFLLGRNDSHKPSLELETNTRTLSASHARDSFNHASERLNKFWELWQTDYIRNLPQVRSSLRGNGLELGSIVLLSEDNMPRMAWSLGRVVRLLPGRDGKVRTVEVKTPKGNLVRAVQRVHRLELDEVSESEFSDENDPGDERSSSGRVIKVPARLDL